MIHAENGNNKPKKHTHVYIEIFYTTLICTLLPPIVPDIWSKWYLPNLGTKLKGKGCLGSSKIISNNCIYKEYKIECNRSEHLNKIECNRSEHLNLQ